jgi:hypothetical protein
MCFSPMRHVMSLLLIETTILIWVRNPPTPLNSVLESKSGLVPVIAIWPTAARCFGRTPSDKRSVFRGGGPASERHAGCCLFHRLSGDTAYPTLCSVALDTCVYRKPYLS